MPAETNSTIKKKDCKKDTVRTFNSSGIKIIIALLPIIIAVNMRLIVVYVRESSFQKTFAWLFRCKCRCRCCSSGIENNLEDVLKIFFHIFGARQARHGHNSQKWSVNRESIYNKSIRNFVWIVGAGLGWNGRSWWEIGSVGMGFDSHHTFQRTR